MLIENQDEVLGRVAVTFAALINPLDGLAKNRFVESVRIMGIWQLVLAHPDMEDEAAKVVDSPEQVV